MKKILALIILISMIVTSLIACKKDDETPGGEENTENTEDGITGGGTEDEGTDGGEELPKVDFLNDDLSEFIELEEKYYKGYTVTVDPNRLKPIEIENYIIQLLCERKSTEPVEGDGIISVGDVVDIYYNGYYLSGEEKVYFEGGSNVGGNAHSLEIGSGGFIPGFEYNMIGKVVSEYSADAPMTVETYFPENYGSAELNGKTAYFEVYVAVNDDGTYKIAEYDAPEFNESFILDTLGFSAENLASYEGEDTVGKFRSLIKEMLINENGLDEDTLAEGAFWESALSGVQIKKYPEGDLQATYDQIVLELENYYNSNIYYVYVYPTLADFATAYFGLGEGESWEDFVLDMAKENLKERLIFYYVIRKEGFVPTEAEYETAFLTYLENTLESMDITRDKYETEEEYLAALDYYKGLIEENGSIDSIREMLYYQFGIKKIIELAVIVEG